MAQRPQRGRRSPGPIPPIGAHGRPKPRIVTDELQQAFDDASGHLALGELEEAAALYRKCVGIDPTHFDSWHALSMALLKTEKLKEALGASLQATSLQPNDLLAWTALSQIYVRLGDIPNAEAAKANSRILSLGGRVVR
ncbi:hypothetical protein HZ994_08020 [Akkermansiaceae bacterium]|nr:hypothetical protein HZ994_08020 [Akkermansiaceae bacterium]